MASSKFSIKDFKVGDFLGEGGFAAVYKAECIKPGCPKEVAIKKISNEKIKKRKIEDRVRKEKDIHRRVDHPNIVKCYTTFEDEDFTYLVLEFCQVTLEKYLQNRGKLIEVEAFDLIQQIVAGLHYLHCNGIMHRDLSLRNILVTEDKKIKIIDFGLSIYFETPSDPLYSIVGTRKFQSPQMHNHEIYDSKSDCWSLGIVILAVLGGKLPNEIGDIEIPKTFSPEAKKLVTGLLQENPAERWSLKDVVESSFFKKYKIMWDNNLFKGIDFCNSRTKKGSSRDSGMDSIGTSFATTGKYSHQSQQSSLDSGFDGFNKSTKSHNNYKISPLSTIISSEHLSQSNHSKTRYKPDINKPLPSSERNKKKIATVPNTCVEPYLHRDLLKHTYPILPSRHTVENLPDESIGRTGYTDALSKEHNILTPLHFASNSDKREHSASEEQRKQERQRIQCEMKKSYSGEAGHSSHHSRDRLKKSQMKSSEQTSKHSSSHRDKGFSPARNNIQTEGIDLKFRKSKRSILDDNSCSKNNLPMGIVHQEASTMKQKPLPFSTERLKACRYPTKKSGFVSILENGEVCVESLKNKNEKQYVSEVVFISSNGKWIDTYKPHNCLVGSTPPPKPNDNKHIKGFPYDTLPPDYWKMYKKAKVLVDYMRANTPRIIYYDKECRCVMMENNPNTDFEMEFFDGGNITQKSNKISITDERGQTISVTEFDRLDKPFADMWDKFCKMKEWCKNMEAQLEAMKSNGKIETLPYPVMFGNPPPAKKCNSIKENFKENIAFPFSEDPATSKSKYTHNSYEKHKRTRSNSSNKYRLNSPSYSCSSPNDIDAIFMKLNSYPQLIKGQVYIEYKDGYTVRCSKDREVVRIYDSRRYCVYDSQNNDKTNSLIDVILQDLPFFVPVAVFSAMKPDVT